MPQTWKTVSDDWFVSFDDGKPPISIGRLPARSPEEAERMVAKIMTYELSASSETVYLVSDISDTFDSGRPASRWELPFLRN